MTSNDECEVLGQIQKITDDGKLGECYTFSITGVKNKRVILLPKDAVTFSVALGRDYSQRAVNIVLENEVRKGKIETVKGQVGSIHRRSRELLTRTMRIPSSLVLLILFVKKARKSSFIIPKSTVDLNCEPVMRWNFMLNTI